MNKSSKNAQKTPAKKAITISVYFEAHLHEKLRRVAAANHRSLSAHLRYLSAMNVAQEEAKEAA